MAGILLCNEMFLSPLHSMCTCVASVMGVRPTRSNPDPDVATERLIHIHNTWRPLSQPCAEPIAGHLSSSSHGQPFWIQRAPRPTTLRPSLVQPGPSAQTPSPAKAALQIPPRFCFIPSRSAAIRLVGRGWLYSGSARLGSAARLDSGNDSGREGDSLS